jgi:hypothetical protein
VSLSGHPTDNARRWWRVPEASKAAAHLRRLVETPLCVLTCSRQGAFRCAVLSCRCARRARISRGVVMFGVGAIRDGSMPASAVCCARPCDVAVI